MGGSSCFRNCGVSQTGIGSINTRQLPCNTGNAPRIDTFGQKSDLRPAYYWRTMMCARYTSVQRRPSGYWRKPDKDCPCDIACRSYQRVDRPTPPSQVRSIMLPEPFDCRGGLCTARRPAVAVGRKSSAFNA